MFTARFVNFKIFDYDWFYSPFTIISGMDYKHVTVTTTTTTTTGTGQKLKEGQIGVGYTGEGSEEHSKECSGSENVLCGCQAIPANQIPAIETVFIPLLSSVILFRSF